MQPPVYPNREHQKANDAARRRAMKALDGIEQELLSLRRKLSYGNPRVDADDAQVLMANAARVPGHLAELGALFDVREWHAADQAADIHRLVSNPALLDAMSEALWMRTDLNLPGNERQADLAKRVIDAMHQDA